MGRKKIIEDAELIRLIDEYFYDVCSGQQSRMKPDLIAGYIQDHGYPGYSGRILRRCGHAKEHIAELCAKADEDIMTLASYNTLDVVRFVENNTSKTAMVAALTARENYIRKVAMTATKVFKQVEKYEDVIKEYEKTIEEQSASIDNMKTEIKSLRTQIRDLKEDNQTYKDVIDAYVYPEIANKILKETTGINAGTTEHIVDDPVIIRADNVLPFTKTLLSVFEEGGGNEDEED